MKPKNQLQKNRLFLQKQTVAKLNDTNMNAVRGGAQAKAATSIPCIVILSLTVSCSNCDAELEEN